ncbi:protein OS-9 isoform X3 [Cherax quadricarinatus]|uniref:protein OS-9 isoform X3 n=1 Tax=Cherax quadricarinatus TaxID=27406 RepID=UPI00387EAC27
MQPFGGYIFIGFILTVAAALNTVLNVDEINSIHYAIDILNKPVVRDQVWDGEVMTVMNKHGQEYICSLPSVAPLDSDFKPDDDILDQLVDISVLLKPMETAPCLIKTVDWWTYEFCYGSVIKQYHLEDNKASGPIIILGKYESEYNWKNSSETKNRLQRFHSQFYVNGTKCDLTGVPRRTEVRFHCEDGVGDYIQRVDEPESCRYVVTVATTRVCHHPYLRLQTVRTPHTITCAPSLTQEQYHRYLTYQDNVNLKVEEIKLSTGTDEIPKIRDNAQDFDKVANTKSKKDKKRTKQSMLDVSEEDEDNLISDLQAQELLQLLHESEDYSDSDAPSTHDDSISVDQESGESYLTEEDELDDVSDIDDDDDDVSEEEVVKETEAARQASKSTKRDHFSKLQRRLKQLGKMFMNQAKQKNFCHQYLPRYGGVKLTEIEPHTATSPTASHPETDGGRKGEKDKIEELQQMVDNIKDGHFKHLEQEVREWTKKLLSKDVLLDMDEEDLEEEEQRLGSALSSLMDALDEAEDKLSTAKKQMETLEEFLDSQLKEMESSANQEARGSALEESTHQDRVDRNFQDPIEGMSQASQILQDSLEGSGAKQPNKNIDKGSGSSQQLRIVKNKMEDESQKTKLEQTIKDRLQKLGLEKIGRKFEVKILTTNSLEDEDTNNPLLSQEETEAFQNMIVNLLSANAEELEERENHRKLEKNYGFKWDDSQFAEDEDE